MMSVPIELDSLTPRVDIPSSPPIGPGQDMEGLGSDYYASIRPYLRYPAFASLPEKSDIYVFDSSPQEKAYSLTSSEIFESHIANTQKPAARIVHVSFDPFLVASSLIISRSICCQNSLRPSGITEQALRKLVSQYDIDTSFFDLVVSFGDKPRSSDAGHGGMKVKQKEDGVCDMQYLFTYAEDDNRGGIASWRIRQVCIFHRYDPSGWGNLWILIHAKPQSNLQGRMEQILSTDPAALLGRWFSMHLLVLSTYLGNWRWYIRTLGDEIEKTVNLALTLDLSNPRTEDHKDRFVHLLKQQYLEDKLASLTSRLGVALTTLHRLEKINSLFISKGFSTDREFQTVADDLTYHITCLEGNLESVNVLERKVRAISDLLAVTLTVENQAVTIDINNKMLGLNNKLLKLTDESLDGNATIRIVTLVTLIYLPASFVSSFLGMNLFSYGSAGNFQISHRFWIFVALAVPLTILTVGSWYCFSRRRQHQKDIR
ncbi:isoform 2 of receptor-interacting serine/threonine-protein kinase 4 [Aspergillus udagawae]|uniref:Isoform 2 of receptor-interacting serine/threonine-protein kinase 4 n=1 Tax=Aspergillus udagawae TaxID=91492 RepID=A0ABQ1BD54_9EURO|nr:isoform 2 of receptor-interacting serine/threonine-protein kinase 4 [Aspergillus udagawae]